MKTLYALVFLCLSVPALADVLDITPIGADEDSIAIASAPAPQPVEDYVDEYNVGPVTTPVTQPTDVAEVQIAERGDDTVIEDDAYTAGVSSPASLKIDDNPIKLDVDFSVDDETGFDFE
jgi:hypothetical protein